MNKNITEIVFVIDKSGSMNRLIDDTIGGFNGFVESQKAVDGTAYLTTVLFSDTHTKLHDHVDIREIPQMDRKQYVVGGMTAMLDAIGETINEVQNRIDNMMEYERPGNVIFVITTDGAENASRRFKKSEVQRMIDHQTKGHGWQFIFLGANMDAVGEASDLGITYSATYVPDSIGTKTVYDAVTCATASLRSTGEIDSNWCNAVVDYAESKENTNAQTNL